MAVFLSIPDASRAIAVIVAALQTIALEAISTIARVAASVPLFVECLT